MARFFMKLASDYEIQKKKQTIWTFIAPNQMLREALLPHLSFFFKAFETERVERKRLGKLCESLKQENLSLNGEKPKPVYFNPEKKEEKLGREGRIYHIMQNPDVYFRSRRITKPKTSVEQDILDANVYAKANSLPEINVCMYVVEINNDNV